MRIFSALDNLLGKENSNLTKMNYDNIRPWIPFLQKESLDGWISSIEGKTAIEFAIVNNPSIIKIIDCVPLLYTWRNSRYSNNLTDFIPKEWGNTYPIHSKIQPVKFILHIRFRPQIEAYSARVEEEDAKGTAFSILLENADITYFNGGPVKQIRWPCVI